MNNEDLRQDPKLETTGHQFHGVADLVPSEPNKSVVKLGSMFDRENDIRLEVRFPRNL